MLFVCILAIFANDQAVHANTQGVPMYRLYNLSSGEHFYTASAYEKDSLNKIGWTYEGIGWYAPSSGQGVHRLYNPNAGDHFYTLSTYEKDSLVRAGWKYEGIGWYSGGNVSLYRQYNSNAKAGSHNYTTNKSESDNLVSHGWRYEGIAWQGISGGVGVPKPTQGKPSYFSQKDPRWSGINFNSHPMSQAGCVPTSLAMVLNGAYGMDVNPATVASVMDSISPQSFGASGGDLIKTTQQYGRNIEQISDMSRAKALLAEGYPLIFFVDVGIGHAVVAYGYDNGRTEIFDPFDRQFYPAGWYSIESVWNKPSKDPVDWNAGRPVFAIKEPTQGRSGSAENFTVVEEQPVDNVRLQLYEAGVDSSGISDEQLAAYAKQASSRGVRVSDYIKSIVK
ncbi:MAG: C39 family peptidase [Streptococcaceae bacterium]|nr:C39 family peptidase [Streptococcaceae bacterium]